MNNRISIGTLSFRNCRRAIEVSYKCLTVSLKYRQIILLKSRSFVALSFSCRYNFDCKRSFGGRWTPFVLSNAQLWQKHILSTIVFQLFVYTKTTKNQAKPYNLSWTYISAFFKFLYLLCLRGLMFFLQISYSSSSCFLLPASFQRLIVVYNLLSGIAGEAMSRQRGNLGKRASQEPFYLKCLIEGSFP